MTDKVIENNQVAIVGEIISGFTYSHEVYGEGFYMTSLKVNRLSDQVDMIPVMISERLVDVSQDYIGETVEITGQFRSYNYHEGTKNRLILSVFAREIRFIDEFYDYKLGALEYRSVRFETEILDCDNYQGNAVVNYTEREVPYTRIIEHKHFEFGTQEKTVISREYSSEWKVGMEPYYPVNNDQNNQLFEEYKKLAAKEENVIFGGRLGNYQYYDMDKVIEAALDLVEKEL